MTTTLPARAAALRARLMQLDKMGSNVAEVTDLEGLRVQLEGRAEKLSVQLQRQKLLTGAGIAVPVPTALVNAQKRAAGLLEKFVADTKAATLKRGQVWRTMLDETDTAIRELGAAVLASWKAHRQSVFAGETPGALRSKLARTKTNTDALNSYERLYTALKTAFETLPPDRETIDQVGRIGSQLETAAQAFDFAVPADVKAFLEAVQSIGGASLALLTPSVLAWLKDSGSLETYRVKSTDRG